VAAFECHLHGFEVPPGRTLANHVSTGNLPERHFDGKPLDAANVQVRSGTSFHTGVSLVVFSGARSGSVQERTAVGPAVPNRYGRRRHSSNEGWAGVSCSCVRFRQTRRSRSVGSAVVRDSPFAVDAFLRPMIVYLRRIERTSNQDSLVVVADESVAIISLACLNWGRYCYLTLFIVTKALITPELVD